MVLAGATLRPVTFGGRPLAVVPAGAQVVSDPVDLPLAAGANVTVTIHLPTASRRPAASRRTPARGRLPICSPVTTSIFLNGPW
jgi:hypothetical protein